MQNEKNQELQALLGNLDNLLNQTDLAEVTADSSGFENLPDGYYLSEVEKAELTVSKTSNQPMVAFTYKVVEDGYAVEFDGNSDVKLDVIKKTKNRKVFMYYVLKDERSIKRFVTDMLKFEGDEEGKPLLEKDYFMNSQLIQDALEILVGMRAYVQISTTENEETNAKNTWQNLISWKRAKALNLPA